MGVKLGQAAKGKEFNQDKCSEVEQMFYAPRAESAYQSKAEGREGLGDGAGTSSKSKQGTLAAKLGHTDITVYLPYHDTKLYWHQNCIPELWDRLLPGKPSKRKFFEFNSKL